MNLTLIVGILVIATMPGLAHAQSAVTNADAQQLVDTITRDPDKSQAFCDSVKLYNQMDTAQQLGQNTDEMNQKMGELTEKLGPEWSTLMNASHDVDLDTRAGLETAVTIQATIDALNKLCPPVHTRD